jgi:hypothetical protein
VPGSLGYFFEGVVGNAQQPLVDEHLSFGCPQIVGFELKTQAFTDAARTDARRIEGLNHLQNGLELGEGQVEIGLSLVGVHPQIAVLVDVIDDVCPRLLGNVSVQTQLKSQIKIQRNIAVAGLLQRVRQLGEIRAGQISFDRSVLHAFVVFLPIHCVARRSVGIGRFFRTLAFGAQRVFIHRQHRIFQHRFFYSIFDL